MSIKETTMQEVIDKAPVNQNGVKKTKTPRQYDSILKGALQLSFAEKVELRKEISKSIETTLENVRNRADEYSKLAKE